MKLPALLHHEIFTPEISHHTTPIVLIHGLFGDLHNLGVLGRELRKTHTVIQIDVRNHGDSPRAQTITYREMAQDVLDLIRSLNIEKVIVIGHSMGGKIAMALAALAPDVTEKLIVIDMAPLLTAYAVMMRLLRHWKMLPPPVSPRALRPPQLWRGASVKKALFRFC